MSNHCLNCEKELDDAFCSGCGQKSDTHRITFRNFIFHDLLHGTFHIEKGILFTAKQALFRPGKAALEYISGKRKRYYNVFLLILMMFATIIFIKHFYESAVISMGDTFEEGRKLNKDSEALKQMLSQKSKFFVLLFVPFAALNSFVLFRRKKLNLMEHLIVAGMVLLGILLITATSNFIWLINVFLPFPEILANIYGWTIPLLVVLYIVYGYVNAFGSDYSKFGVSHRMVLFFLLFCVEIVLMFYVIVGLITNWKYGTQITLTNPF